MAGALGDIWNRCSGNGENKLYDGGDYGAKIVSSNPGFAAVFNSRCWGKSFDGYTGVTGFFNADYKAVHSDYTEYWHEGIDFRGNKDTQIKSLIYGQVVDFGTHTGNHNSGKGMGDYMIV